MTNPCKAGSCLQLAILLFIIVALLPTQGCEGCHKPIDADKDGVPDKKDNCPTTGLAGKVDTSGCPLVEIKTGSVRFYLDNSDSNWGYLTENSSTYKDVISDLISTLSDPGTQTAAAIAYLSDRLTPFEGSAVKFISVLNGNKTLKKAGSCSELHNMLDTILSRSNPNDVSILVSDFILSFCKNTEQNKQSALLRTETKLAFNKVRKKDFALSIFAFHSDFKGTYYVASNGDRGVRCSGERPFYIMVAANKKILQEFNGRLAQSPRFKPAEQLHFGIADESITTVAGIFNRTGKKGQWKSKPASAHLYDVEITRKEPEIQFVLGLNLEELPSYTKDTSYLRRNLKWESERLTLVDIREKKNFFLDKKGLAKEKQLLDECSHLLTFRLKDMIHETEKIPIALQKAPDTWYEEWSTGNDANPNEGKTYFLNYLVDGIKEAYGHQQQPFLEVTLTIDK